MRYYRDGDVLVWQIPLDKYEPKLVFAGKRKRISRIAREHGTCHGAGGTVLYAINTGIPVQSVYTWGNLHYDYKGDVLFYQDLEGKHRVYRLPPDKYLGYKMHEMRWGFGVCAQLVKDGKVDLQYRRDWLHGLVKARHPRTAYGVKGNTFIVVTVDGRRYGRGMTGPELAEYMASLGCDTAVMSDGGGSSEAYINSRVRNRPSDGCERPQPAALLFFKKGSKKVLDIHRLLYVGKRGSDVRELQSALHSLGYDPGPIDGIFGKLTKSAVIKFQAEKGIIVDGIVGPQTLGKMREVL